MGDKLIKLNVYDENENILKTVEAHLIDIRFGTIKKLLKVLEIEQIDDTSELFKTLYSSWKAVTTILSRVFPQMEEDDWDGVKLSELLPVLLAIFRGSFAQLSNIPVDSKNVIAE